MDNRTINKHLAY